MTLNDLKGSWALVTGASAGIGREFCQQFASLGMNLVLVARRQHLLEQLASELRARHAIQAFVLPADLRHEFAAAEIRAKTGAEGIRVRLLCNNAAIGRWGRFERTTADTYQQMVSVNTSSLVTLCHAFLPDLVSFRGSVIINVSSPAALQPVPYMAVYAATKAFVNSFSQALYEEWRQRGVLVKTLIPGPTKTEFDANAGAYTSKIVERGEAADVVRLCLQDLMRESPLVVAAKGTFRQRLLAALLPSRLMVREVGKMFQPHD